MTFWIIIKSTKHSKKKHLGLHVSATPCASHGSHLQWNQDLQKLERDIEILIHLLHPRLLVILTGSPKYTLLYRVSKHKVCFLF